MSDAMMELQQRSFELDAALDGIADAPGRKGAIVKYLKDVADLSAGISLPALDPLWSWFNVETPLTLEHFSGRVVVLDFFTYCCINCMHILPDLEAIEERHGTDEVLVVGVHR